MHRVTRCPSLECYVTSQNFGPKSQHSMSGRECPSWITCWGHWSNEDMWLNVDCGASVALKKKNGGVFLLLWSYPAKKASGCFCRQLWLAMSIRIWREGEISVPPTRICWGKLKGLIPENYILFCLGRNILLHFSDCPHEDIVAWTCLLGYEHKNPLMPTLSLCHWSQ